MGNSGANLATSIQGTTRGVRFPSLTSENATTSDVDRGSDSYKAGFSEGRATIAEEAAELAAAHETFARSIETVLQNIDTQYRDECIGLVRRLFAAVAPTLAKKSTMNDVMTLVEERVLGAHAEMNLHVHPSLIAHLTDAQRKVLDDNPLLHLHPDETASPASLDAKWARGGLFHDPDNLISEILSALGEAEAPTQEPAE